MTLERNESSAGVGCLMSLTCPVRLVRAPQLFTEQGIVMMGTCHAHFPVLHYELATKTALRKADDFHI